MRRRHEYRRKPRRILAGLGGAAVEDAGGLGGLGAEVLGQGGADGSTHFLSVLAGGDLAHPHAFGDGRRGNEHGRSRRDGGDALDGLAQAHLISEQGTVPRCEPLHSGSLKRVKTLSTLRQLGIDTGDALLGRLKVFSVESALAEDKAAAPPLLPGQEAPGDSQSAETAAEPEEKKGE